MTSRLRIWDLTNTDAPSIVPITAADYAALCPPFRPARVLERGIGPLFFTSAARIHLGVGVTVTATASSSENGSIFLAAGCESGDVVPADLVPGEVSLTLDVLPSLRTGAAPVGPSLGVFYGDWMGPGEYPIAQVRRLQNGDAVFVVGVGDHVKMVNARGDCRYIYDMAPLARIDTFRGEDWELYDKAPFGSYRVCMPGKSAVLRGAAPSTSIKLLGELFGPNVSGALAIAQIRRLRDGNAVFIAVDAGSVTMVSSRGECRSYRGENVDAFDVDKWEHYDLAAIGDFNVRDVGVL